MIAKEMKLSHFQIRNIYIGALLHDTGKIGIPENILQKASKLTYNEYNIIQNHPVIGFDTLKHIDLFRKTKILDIVRHHHERYDGTGYPNQLKGKEIPLEARIVCLADAFDAITSKRVYRDALSAERTMAEIQKNSGKQFEPFIANSFLKILTIQKDIL